MIELYYMDNLEYLKQEKRKFDLIIIDPPYNTGITQKRDRFITYAGKRIPVPSYGYNDSFDNFIDWMHPRLELAYNLLKDNGSFFTFIDYRESAYLKILLDEIFGRSNYMNTIIWAYDYGARSKQKWSPKHDDIHWYVKDNKNYTFNYDVIDRIPYMAPDLVGPEKAAKGKTPTDVWWQTIVPTNSKEKTGYATQKPIKLLERIISVHSNPGDLVCDFFAGSGTTGEACQKLGRNCILVDQNLDAIKIMEKRLSIKCNNS